MIVGAGLEQGSGDEAGSGLDRGDHGVLQRRVHQVEGATKLHETGDYTEYCENLFPLPRVHRAVEVLAPIMTELQSCIQGSWAQKDVFRQILLDACIRSGDDDDYNNSDVDDDINPASGRAQPPTSPWPATSLTPRWCR